MLPYVWEGQPAADNLMSHFKICSCNIKKKSKFCLLSIIQSYKTKITVKLMMLVGVYDHNVLTAMAEVANLDLGVRIYI